MGTNVKPAAGLTLGGLMFLLTSCSARSTSPTEIGVHTRRLFAAGIEQRAYPPGRTYFFAPFLADWATFDVTLQNLVMADRPGSENPIELKTRDGADIRVDVTVSWRINPEKAPELLARIGHSTLQVGDGFVGPVSRSVVRDVLNDLDSGDYYIPERRFHKAAQARQSLTDELAADGILVEQVLLGQHRFKPGYEEVIRARKLAEQSRERLRSESAAAEAAQLRDLDQARGDVRVAVTQAKGAAERLRIAADRQFYEHGSEARATLAERTAIAAALEKQCQAMSGPGGELRVKLRIAEALTGKSIVVMPQAAGATLQALDLNQLFEMALKPGEQ